MEYVILDTYPRINGEVRTNFIEINSIDGDIANINICNNSSVAYNVRIINHDITKSINDFFVEISDKE